MQNPPKKLLAAILAKVNSRIAAAKDKPWPVTKLGEPGFDAEQDKPLAIPFVKDASDEQQRKFVVICMVASFALALILMAAGALTDQRKAESVDRLQALDTALQEAGTAIKLAPFGSERDYALGDYAETVISSRLTAFASSTSSPLGVDLSAILGKLEEVNKLLHSVMEKESVLTGFSKRTAKTHELLVQTSQNLDQVVFSDQAAGGSSNTALYAHMRESAQRADNLVLQFVAIEGNAETNMRILASDLGDLARLSTYFKGVPGIHIDPPSRDIAAAIARVGDMSPELIEYRKTVEDAIESFTFAKRSARGIDEQLDPLIEDIREKTDLLRGSYRAQLLYGFAVALAVFGALCIILMQAIHGRAAQRLVVRARHEQDETDEAIIRIMEELQPISQGDLTARATVTEHVTGAIADRVNMAAESLNHAIDDVKRAAVEAAELMTAIHTGSAGTIDDFQSAALQASDSRNVAELGAAVVADAVGKMDDARERMQDVSKRVKRLGEVSQAITSIVDLIEEVTQKTSILALNTSLKAAEAGEEGQAFQVIAKEIRDLSDDARKALRQIGQNVRMIQSETQSVIQTVEAVTQDVVEGSRLWEDARITLNNITTSSEQIEQMVTQLSGMAKQQAEKAAAASCVMGELSTSVGQFKTQAA